MVVQPLSILSPSHDANQTLFGALRSTRSRNSDSFPGTYRTPRRAFVTSNATTHSVGHQSKWCTVCNTMRLMVQRIAIHVLVCASLAHLDTLAYRPWPNVRAREFPAVWPHFYALRCANAEGTPWRFSGMWNRPCTNVAPDQRNCSWSALLVRLGFYRNCVIS